MPRIEEHNITTPELILKWGAAAAHPRITSWEVRAVYQRDNGRSWELFSAQIMPAVEEIEESSHQYPEKAFFVRVCEFTSPSQLISNLLGEGVDIAPGFPPITTRKDQWKEILVPSHASPLGTPLRHTLIHVGATRWADSSLVGYGLPYFSSFNKRVKEFIQWGSNEPAVHILVDDYRASLQLTNGQVQVKVSDDLDLDLVGEIESDAGLNKHGGHPMPEILDLGSAKSVELWLISKNGTVYDYISSSTFKHRYECQMPILSGAEQIISLIKSGEGNKIEYKQYVDLRNGNGKSEEIVQTICAFSNAEGGTLLIGVSDTAELIGVSQAIRRTYKMDIGEALTNYHKDLHKLLCESLTDADCFLIESIEVCGKWVVKIEVSKNFRWNVVRFNNIPYLRRGASNVNATSTAITSLTQNTTGIAEHAI